LPREEVLNKLKKCHILVHPSLHDSGGFVCLEAMAAGRPVVCLDLGGPGAQVTKESGFKISAHDSEQVVRDMAETMICLANDPELRNRMGKAGQRMASEIYSWEVKGKFFIELYKKISSKNVI
jgi:glycosyltransferase involved in cell wall biosynthesis